MPKFLLAYHGSPKFETREDGAAHMAAWRAWMESLGKAIVNPGIPVGASKTIHSDGKVTDDGGANPLAGITIISADTIGDAIRMASPCPHLSAGGTIEVAPALDMEM